MTRRTPYDQTVNINNALETLIRSFPVYFIVIFLITRFGAGISGPLALAVSFLLTLTVIIILAVVLRPKRMSIMLCGAAISALLLSLPPLFIREFFIEIEIYGSPVRIGWSDVILWLNMLIGFGVFCLLMTLSKLAFDHEQNIAGRALRDHWVESETKPNKAKKLDDEVIGGDAEGMKTSEDSKPKRS